jgi:hypothetical protein
LDKDFLNKFTIGSEQGAFTVEHQSWTLPENRFPVEVAELTPKSIAAQHPKKSLTQNNTPPKEVFMFSTEQRIFIKWKKYKEFSSFFKIFCNKCAFSTSIR